MAGDAGMRAIAARRSGMRCEYCGCPTAAEIEHVHPRSYGGRTHMDNLVLSCPYCNKRKAQRDVEEFRESGDWKLLTPKLPGTMSEMLSQNFGWSEGDGTVRTGSSNSILVISAGIAEIRIRPGRKYPWQQIIIGEVDEPRTIAASWDFLRRHFTPKEPRQPKYQKSWKKKPRRKR
jgi:5-methylcytosine-specific restriction endonuclease McrA